jgi:muramoyltetrapeptide carboxypeptidase
MNQGRRNFMTTTALSAAPIAATSATSATPARPLLRPRRLRPGDTVALINPSSALYEREPYAIAVESLQALGFRVRESPNLRARYGHLAGTDAQRADDLNALFADPGVHGLLAFRGGSGCNRILPLIDYALVRGNPKFVGGYSDTTALLTALHAQTGLVTFHSPMGTSEWNDFNVQSFRGAVMQAQALTLANVPTREDALVSTGGRIATLRGGRAQGRLMGGNLSVLVSLAGTPYWPVWDGAILFLEEVNEEIYRVDRMLSTLKLAGVLDRLSGVVLGAFTRCGPGEGYGSLTLDEVFDDYFQPLNVPVYAGAQFGHVKRKFTLPVGLTVEMDADHGTVRFLQPAVT